MKEYLIRLEDDISPTDISHIDEDGAVWVCHHYGKLGETTADSMIVELPPHGRLIDADCFLTATKEVHLERPIRNNGTEIIELGELFAEFINNAPIIIEASKEKEK